MSEYPLQTYLREIAAVPLLTREQEQQLGRRVEQGDMEAREQMIRANLRLVVNIARAFQGKGVPLEDLIEDGNLGLMRAVEMFDPERGIRFSTYASFWIKQGIHREIQNIAKPIRLPVYLRELLRKWFSVERRLQKQFHRHPSHEEVGQEMHMNKQKLRTMKMALRLHGCILVTELSGADDKGPLLAKLVDTRTKTPDVIAEESDHASLDALLDRMDGREATVLRMRFGLDGEGSKSMAAVALVIGVTRSRVQQIEQKALGKLRKCMEA